GHDPRARQSRRLWAMSDRWLGAAVAALTTDVVCVIDAETRRFLAVNAAFTQAFGYTAADAQSLAFEELCDTEALDVFGRLSELERQRRSSTRLLSCRGKDG